VTYAVRDLIAIGAIVKAFGIKGEIIIEPLTDMPERFRSLRRVLLVSETAAKGLADEKPVVTEVTAVQIEARGIRMSLACAPDRTAAEALVGKLVMIPQEEAVTLPPGTFFVHQVIGYRAVDEHGATLGTLADVLRFPAMTSTSSPRTVSRISWCLPSVSLSKRSTVPRAPLPSG